MSNRHKLRRAESRPRPALALTVSPAGEVGLRTALPPHQAAALLRHVADQLDATTNPTLAASS